MMARENEASFHRIRGRLVRLPGFTLGHPPQGHVTACDRLSIR